MSARKSYTRESIAHALAHHESRGVLRTVSPPEPGGRSTWRVTTAKLLEPMELTEPQAWALCIGLAAGEDHARVEHERFVHELHAYNGAESPPCIDDDADLAQHSDTKLPPGTRCGIHGDNTESGRCESCDLATLHELTAQLDAATKFEQAEEPFEQLCKLVDITHSERVRHEALAWSQQVEALQGHQP